MNFLIFFSLLFANHLDPSKLIVGPMSSTQALPECYVEGVNVITGDYTCTEVDMEVRGGRRVAFERYYNSGEKFNRLTLGGWRHNAGGFLGQLSYYDQGNYESKRAYATLQLRLTDGKDLVLFGPLFENRKVRDKTFQIDPDRFESMGLTNGAYGSFSEWTHPVDISANLNSLTEVVSINLPCGGSAQYSRNTFSEGNVSYNGTFYLLSEELRGDGVRCAYETSDHYHPITYRMTDYSGEHLHGAFYFNIPDKKDFTRLLKSSMKSNLGQSVNYTYQVSKRKGDQGYFMTSAAGEGIIPKRYEYNGFGYPNRSRLVKRTLPEGRFKEIEYDGKGRVKALKGPFGTTHTFTYRMGVTEVVDAAGLLTIYQFNNRQHLQTISKHENGKLVSEERFQWNDHSCNLAARSIYDAHGNLVSEKSWEYDEKGNVTSETLFGQLTGEAHSKQRYVLSSRYENGYRFTSDMSKGVYEVFDGNIKKMHLEVIEGNQAKRTRYSYNKHGLIAEEITDNGYEVDSDAGVTERQFVRYRRNAAGLPDKIERGYFSFESGQDVVETVTLNAYDELGNHTRQDVFNPLGEVLQVWQWGYNVYGQKIFEIDPVGQRIDWEYDANGNLVGEIYAGGGVRRFSYDVANRMVKKYELSPEGSEKSEEYTYDIMGRLIEKSEGDSFTNYEYDPLGRPIKIYLPCGPEEDRPVEKYRYNVLGNVIEKTDIHGGVTTTVNNVYGSPIKISHPDGTWETFRYLPSGEMVEHRCTDGSTITRQLDGWKRVVSMTHKSLKGDFEIATFQEYSGERLHKVVGGAGSVKEYTYDSAGRLIKESCGECVKKYAYNALGHVVFTQMGDEYGIYYERDALGRVLKESVGPGQVETVYSYDAFGRQTSCTVDRDGVKCTTKTTYDFFGREISQTDPDGNTTAKHYKPGLIIKINADGSKAYREINPRGDPLREWNDHTETFYTYDKAHRLAGKNVNGVLTEYLYNDLGQLKVERLRGNETVYGYNQHGQKNFVVYPDGQALEITYYTSNHPRRISSQDHTLDYELHYDRSGRVCEVYDGVNRLTSKHIYTSTGKLKKEVLSNRHQVEYSYDTTDRLTRLTLPDGSSINYVYDLFLLKEIHRGGYVHTFCQYNFAGECTCEMLMGKAGMLEKTYYSNGLISSLTNKNLELKDAKYTALGQLSGVQRTDEYGEVQCSFEYDTCGRLFSEEGLTKYHCNYSGPSMTALNRAPLQHNEYGDVISGMDFFIGYDGLGRVNSYKQRKSKLLFSYDALGRLSESRLGNLKYVYLYDPFGRLMISQKYITKNNGKTWMAKRRRSFIYQGDVEIGCSDNRNYKTLRIVNPSTTASVAIESNGELFVPLSDLHGHMAYLLSPKYGSPRESYRYTALGKLTKFHFSGEARPNAFNQTEITSLTSWRAFQSRIDDEMGFIWNDGQPKIIF